MKFWRGVVVLMSAGVVTVAGAQVPVKLTRSSVAQNIAFTMTDTLVPKNGSKVVRTFQVELKGKKARMDYNDPALGAVRYLINEKGTFFYIPANKAAQKVNSNVEMALELAFSRVREQLKNAKKVGVQTVSGIPTTVYKDAKSGATVLMGNHPGYKLPVKVTVANEGGTQTMLVSNIKFNPNLPDMRFALPAGTQVMDTGTGNAPK
jgi:outer membrane lipoprotein-sorting protein